MKKTIALTLALLLLMLTACAVKPEDSRAVLTLDGEKIPYDYFRYVFLNTRDDLAYGAGEDYWEEEDHREALSASVMETLLRNKAILEMAEEYEIRLTGDDKKAISQYVKNAKKEMGSEEAFRESLAKSYLTEYSLRYVQQLTMLWDKLYSYVTNEMSGIIKSSDEILFADIPVNFRNIRYLLISNDEKDNREENRALAERLREQAAKGEDFKELIEKHGEDDTMESLLEDGYYFTFGSIAEEIEEVVRGLQENEISQVVDMGYGYFIVQRLPLDDDYVKENLEQFREIYCARVFNEMLAGRAEHIEVKYEPLFEELTASMLK